MDLYLSASEARVLGVLLEKEMATPDYYPLSLSAAINACNQKSNRNPVVTYDEETVLLAFDGLQDKGIVRRSMAARVPKYEQTFTGPRNLVRREAAVLCILLLRGAQTMGEIRSRTERLFPFADLAAVEETIAALTDMEMVKKLPRRPGRKEPRYTHLFCGEPEDVDDDDLRETPEDGAGQGPSRVTVLEEEVAQLRQEIDELKTRFAQFAAQFE